jgi:hypothetical protein
MGHIMAVRRFTDRKMHVCPARFEKIPKRAWRWVMSDFENGPGPHFETGLLSLFGNWAHRWGWPI